MKKILASVLALTLVFGSVAVPGDNSALINGKSFITANAGGSYDYEDCTSGDYEIRVYTDTESDEKYCYILRYIGNDSDIVIPAEIDGLPVCGIEDYAFAGEFSEDTYDYAGIDSLKSVTFQNNIYTISNYAFLNCKNLETINLPDELVCINDSAFSGCSSLKNIKLPETVNTISSYAFFNCTSLTEIYIPADVSFLGENVFANCSSLKKVEFGETYLLDAIPVCAFSCCEALENITIPDSISTIEDLAFTDCKSLSEINLPYNLIKIGENTFEACFSLDAINADADSEIFSSENGVLYNKDKTNLVMYPTGKADASFKLPETVTSIGKGAFYGCAKLTSVEMGDNLQIIDVNAFCCCEALEEVKLSKNLKTINDGAFGSTGLKHIEIPEGVETIGLDAFGFCQQLESVKLPSTLKNLGASAFSSSAITSIEIPSGVKKIEMCTFSNCPNLKKAVISEGTEYICSEAFSDCSLLESVTIPDSVVHVEAGAFTNTLVCNNQTTPVKYIGKWAVAYDGSSSSVSVKDGTECISDRCFVPGYNYNTGVEDAGLTSISLPSSLKYIGYSAFSRNKNLKSVTLPSSLTAVDAYAFEGCTSLKTVTIPKSTVAIGDLAFGFYSDETVWEYMPVNGFKLKCYENTAGQDYAENFGVDYSLITPVKHRHAYKGKITRNPTCTSSGIKTFTCSCGKKYTEVIPALGHKWTKIKTVKPTITKRGYVIYKCSRCGKKLVKYSPSYLSLTTFSKVPNYRYTGKQIRPMVRVTYNKKALRYKKDYTLTFGKNIRGRASVTVTGTGIYKGKIKKTIYFTIK